MAYIYDLTDTWSAGGTTFNAIKMNVTDSASASGSKLVTLQTNGTEHFSVTKAGVGYFSGNVGIGTSGQPDKLFVYANTASSALAVRNDGGGPLQTWATFGTERMRITAGGDVGIGTSSPGYLFDVNGQARLGGSSGVVFGVGTAFAGGQAEMYSVSTTPLGIGTTGAASMQLYTNSAERMRITSAGNVGIGTSSPSDLLHVNGNIRIGAATGANYIYSASTSLLALQTGMGAPLLFLSNNGGTETMRITSDGKVGIGTSTPYGGQMTIIPSSNPTTASASTNQIAIGEATANNSYKLNIGYIFSGGAYSGSLQAIAGGTGASLLLNADGGSVGIGTTTPQRRLGIGGTANSYMSFNPTSYTQFTLGSDSNGFVLYDDSAATYRMTVNSSGNVGIGTTAPNAKLDLIGGASQRKIQLTGSAFGTTVTDVYIGRTGANSAGLAQAPSIQLGNDTDASGVILQGSNQFQIFTNNAGAGWNERMRIDASGNVGFGTASPAYKLHVATGATGVIANFSDGIAQTIQITTGSGWAGLNNANGGAITFGNNVETMRLDASGNLLVGTTSGTGRTGVLSRFVSSAPSGYDTSYFLQTENTSYAIVSHVNTTSGTRYHMGFGDGATWTERGTISTNGTGTSYNTSSDYRLKDIDGPITDSGAYIDALKPVQGSWKADGSRFIGLLAHEVQEVSETSIATGEKDGEAMQAMDYSAPEIIANLIAELQSLRARVAQLEGN